VDGDAVSLGKYETCLVVPIQLYSNIMSRILFLTGTQLAQLCNIISCSWRAPWSSMETSTVQFLNALYDSTTQISNHKKW